MKLAFAILFLASVASARPILFLDFDGDTNPATPPFAGSAADIQEIRARVAEKFEGFNLDVTTVDPENIGARGTGRVLIGGNGAWNGGGEGGTSNLAGFNSIIPESHNAYVFSDLFGGSDKNIAEIVAHETGHLLGMGHQSVWDGDTLVAEYNAGDANYAPIMGVSYYAEHGIWWKGFNSAHIWQDDAAMIAEALPEPSTGAMLAAALVLSQVREIRHR